LLNRGRITRREISRDAEQTAIQNSNSRLPELGHEGSQIILPQMQIAAGKIFGIGHYPQYMPEHL